MNHKQPKKTPWMRLLALLGFCAFTAPITGCGGGGGGGGGSITNTPNNPSPDTASLVLARQDADAYRFTVRVCRYGVQANSSCTFDPGNATGQQVKTWATDSCQDISQNYYGRGDFTANLTCTGRSSTWSWQIPSSPTSGTGASNRITGMACPSRVPANQKLGCSCSSSNGTGTCEFSTPGQVAKQAAVGASAEFTLTQPGGPYIIQAILLGGDGTVMSQSVIVDPADTSIPPTPRLAQGYTLPVLYNGTSISGVQLEISTRCTQIEIVNGRSVKFNTSGTNRISVNLHLDREGTNDLRAVCIASGSSSTPMEFPPIERFNNKPSRPNVDDCLVSNGQATCTGTKMLGFALWVTPPSGSAYEAIPRGTYIGEGWSNLVPYTASIQLPNNGLQTINFQHRVNTEPSVQQSDMLPIQLNNTTGGGGGNNQTGQNPPVCAGFVVSPTSGTTTQTYTATLNLGGTCTDQRVSWGDGTDFVDSNCSQTTTTHTYSNTGTWTPTIYRNNSAANGGSCQQNAPAITVSTTGGGTGGTFVYTKEVATTPQFEDITTDGVFIYGVNSTTKAVYKVDLNGTQQGATWTNQNTGAPAGELMDQPGSITFCNNEILVGDLNARKIFRFTTTGSYLGQIQNQAFNTVSGLGCGTSGGATRLLVADYGANRVHYYDASSRLLLWSGAVNSAMDMALDSNGIAYGLSRDGFIKRFTVDGSVLGDIATGMSLPTRIAIATYTQGIDTLLVTENGNSRIKVLDISGATSTVFGGAGTSGAGTSNPSGIVVIGSQEVISTMSGTSGQGALKFF